MVSPLISPVFSPGQISADAYQWIRDFVYHEAGIDLGPSRQMLVISRLHNRLVDCQTNSFDAYTGVLANPNNAQERHAAIDLLSTHETYFFRESDHLEILRSRVLQTHPRGQPLRIWSAASSSGEEAYSIAMVLSEACGDTVDWEIFGSDISNRVVRQAQTGLYLLQRINGIPQDYLKLYCLKGIGRYKDYFLIDARLRKHCRFDVVNLVRPLPDLGLFDVIFFRNALIYFDDETKENVVHRLLTKLRQGGVLFIGHSESLTRMDLPLEMIAPTTYQKTGND